MILISFFVFAFLAPELMRAKVIDHRVVIKELSVTNGGSRGIWHKDHMCPPGSFAAGFEIRVQPDGGLDVDDTAQNAVWLYCKTQGNIQVGEAYSYKGYWGEWTGRQDCPHGNGETMFLTSFALKVAGAQTAVNNIRFRCRSFSGGLEFSYDGMAGGPWGEWGEWSADCPSGSAVCGVAVKFLGPQLCTQGPDNSALNDVWFYCCNN